MVSVCVLFTPLYPGEVESLLVTVEHHAVAIAVTLEQVTDPLLPITLQRYKIILNFCKHLPL